MNALIDTVESEHPADEPEVFTGCEIIVEERVVANDADQTTKASTLPSKYPAPPIRTSPASGLVSVAKTLIKVVLPEPLGPSRLRTVPLGNVKVNSPQDGRASEGLGQSSYLYGRRFFSRSHRRSIRCVSFTEYSP